MKKPRYILFVIVLAQFCCTSLWFASNGVLNNLIESFDFAQSALSHLTSAIQLGFILGSLCFAILTITDRISPSKVFFTSALLAGLFNYCITLGEHTLGSLFLLRLMTGFFLAGIYPVGMKIATDYFDKGLGRSLGFLVGALVLGTAFPHLLYGVFSKYNWTYVIYGTTILSVFGGFIILVFVSDGPFRKAGKTLDFLAFFKVFKNKSFRSPAFGYFGHMWELYTFWAMVPIMLSSYFSIHKLNTAIIPLLSFAIIGIGSLSCILSGYFSLKVGTKKLAMICLSLSGLCCLVSPLIFAVPSVEIFIIFLLFWGAFVIADSPLFSTLVAQNAHPQIKGTALTIVNCIGYTITIISIQCLHLVSTLTNSATIYMLLAIGPALGLYFMRRED